MTPVLVSLPWAVLCGGLLYALTRTLDRAHTERQQLLQRIQAPEQAVIEHAAVPSDGPLFVSPFDDDGFNELKERPE
jgi:hypothetical protein